MHQIPSRSEVLRLLAQSGTGPLRARELARRLGVHTDSYRAFRRLLQELERAGDVIRHRKGRYTLPERLEIVTGIVDLTRSGDGFIVPEVAGDEDVFVPRRLLGSAVQGDRVAVRVERRRPGRNREGRLVRVLARAHERVVGVYHQRRGYGSVASQEPVLPVEVFVPDSARGGARHGDVVLTLIREWGEAELRPVGEVAQVLGQPGDPGLDVLTILLGHGLPLEFPDSVTREADRIARRGLRPEDLHDREDFRGAVCFTIDPEDARDHDDALSVTHDGDILEVGVHIADVAWYVKEGSAVDREARQRGTSVYLVDRVVPMLPEALSSGLCSLLPGEDRLTVSMVFRFDAGGRRVDSRVTRSVVRSLGRLSYEQAQALLAEDTDPEASEDVSRALRALVPVCRRLRQTRASAGAIDFDLPEAAVTLDERGEPVEIRERPRLEAHRIIEDLMILANESIAQLGIERRVPLLYRIHEKPDPDRIESLRELAGFFGHRLPAREVRPKDLALLVESTRDQPHEKLITTVALRSMRQARYAVRNVGHFGLASTAYAHFTSPIRRYPDLVVHRQIVKWLGGRPVGADPDLLEMIARHCSQRERRAQEAERDSVDAKKMLFMLRHVGDEFDGTISGVTGFGLFVSLDGVLAEGLIRLDVLEDDYYRLDADGHAVVGRRAGRRYRLGDRISVRVVRVDLEAREVDLEPVDGLA